MLNALSVDVEEWYQTVLFSHNKDDNFRVTTLPQNICDILSLLDQYNIKATFFIVGSVAEKYPGIIKTIADEGHEIASHGYMHRLVYKMSKRDFIDDVSCSLHILEGITQGKILGYRAPTWSITRNLHWAAEALRSLGFRYDSSIYPLSLNLLKSLKIEKHPYKLRDDFIEFPPSVFQFLGYNFPFAGGTFLRLFPFDFIKRRIVEINQRQKPAMIYFHSWEFDIGAPKINLPIWKLLIQYGNIQSVKEKIKLLLQTFQFSTIGNILGFNNE